MPRLLKKYRFKESDVDLPEVRGFYCGPNRWDVVVATWIQSRSGDNSVLEDCEVEEKDEILRQGEQEKRRAAGEALA